jgi:8-oxo-dGTP diphosphatase
MSAVYRYKVRLGVILLRDDRILLVRQNNRPFWVLPGGTLEPEEGLEECAIREIKEEINLTISIQKVLYLADFLQPADPKEPELGPKHTIDVFMLGEYISGVPMMALDENLNDMGFFTFDEFQQRAVQPDIVAEQLIQDWPNGFVNANGLYLGKYGVR